MGLRIRPLGWIMILLVIGAVLYFILGPVLGPLIGPTTEKVVEMVRTPAVVAVQPTPIRVEVATLPPPTATPVPASPTPIPVEPTETPVKPVKVSPTPTTAAKVLASPTPAPAVERPKFRVALDAFGSYFPPLQIVQMPERTYDLELIPFLIDGEGGEYDFDEDQRAEALETGEWDVLLTTADALARTGNIGVVPVVIDQSAGADKVVAWPNAVTTIDRRPIEKFNDLAGLTITFSEGSVGHYQVLAILRVVGLTHEDVNMLPAASVAEAVQLFVEKKADAVAAWEPDVLNAIDAGGQELVSSDWWRNISDVIVVSHKANTTKREVVKAFLRDWFRALKVQQEDLPTAAAVIASWHFDDMETNDWSFVYPESATEDLGLWLESIAQAGLGANAIIMENPELLAEQLQAAREVWAWGGLVDTSRTFDPEHIIEPSYILELAHEVELQPIGGSFVNNTFQPIVPALPSASAEALVEVPTFAELPCRKFDFYPDDPVMKPESLPVLEECAKAMIQMLRTSDARILVTGCSAWPGPEGRFSKEDIEKFAQLRAIGVQTALVQMGVDPNRIAVLLEIPPEEDWNLTDEARLEPYRRVVIEAKRGGR